MKWIKSNKDVKDDVLKPGMVFERYTVVKQLGQGGMGSVYLVRHNVLDSLFALKILASDVASKNKQFVDRFIREAKLACKIRHPNLIAVHDAGQNPKNGLYYIVMDYVSGGSVRDRLKKTPRIPPAEALAIITQVADALTAACAHHMVHRDIKPDNIMFAADGSVKLADLGIAKSTDEQDTMITMASSVFGTPAYMSPEQAKDSSKVDSRADIYSLGIVFFEMLSGQRPFNGSTAIQILSQVMDSSSIPDIRQLCPEAPPDLALLISRMSEKNLEKRIQNPDILLQELKKIRIPPQIGARPLRLREEIAAGSPAIGSGGQTPDVTMPTVSTVSDAPAGAPDVTMPTVSTVSDVPVGAPDVTMPTMAAAPSVAPAPAPVPEPKSPAPAPAPVTPAPEPESPAPAPAPVAPAPESPAPAPIVTPAPEAPVPAEVTMPTMAAAPVAPAPAPVPEPKSPAPAPAPVTPAPEALAPTSAPAPSAPEVTMPTMAAPSAPAPAPAPSAAPAAASPRRNAASPAPSAPAPVASKKKDTSGPTPSAQPNKKRGVLVVSLAAVGLIVISGVILAAVFLLGGNSVPEPVPTPDPVQQVVSPSGSDMPSGGTLITDSDQSVKTSIPESKPDTGTVPDAGSLADGSRGNDPKPSGISGSRDVPAVDISPEPEEMTSDPLGKNQVVLLADISNLSRKTKEVLSGAFGAENVSFQEAEGMGS